MLQRGLCWGSEVCVGGVRSVLGKRDLCWGSEVCARGVRFVPGPDTGDKSWAATPFSALLEGAGCGGSLFTPWEKSKVSPL